MRVGVAAAGRRARAGLWRGQPLAVPHVPGAHERLPLLPGPVPEPELHHRVLHRTLVPEEVGEGRGGEGVYCTWVQSDVDTTAQGKEGESRPQPNPSNLDGNTLRQDWSANLYTSIYKYSYTGKFITFLNKVECIYIHI